MQTHTQGTKKKCVFNLSIPFLFGDHLPKSLQANVMTSVLKQAMSTVLLLYHYTKSPWILHIT